MMQIVVEMSGLCFNCCCARKLKSFSIVFEKKLKQLVYNFYQLFLKNLTTFFSEACGVSLHYYLLIYIRLLFIVVVWSIPHEQNFSYPAKVEFGYDSDDLIFVLTQTRAMMLGFVRFTFVSQILMPSTQGHLQLHF